MKYLGIVMFVSLLLLGCTQETTSPPGEGDSPNPPDEDDSPGDDETGQTFRVGNISFSIDSFEVGDSAVTLSVTVTNGDSDAIELNKEELEPLLVNDTGESAFGSLPKNAEVAAGASETYDLNFAGLSGNFFTLAFNAPKDLIISGPGVWPVYYVGPILTDSVTLGTQTGSKTLDLSATGSLGDTGKTLEARVEEVSLDDGDIVLTVSLSREEGDDVTSVTSFAYLGLDCYAPTRISLTDANGTVYVPDYEAGLLADAPELKVSDSVGETSYRGKLYFTPLLEGTKGPLNLNFNACTESIPQQKKWSPPLTIEGISLPVQ